MTELSELEHAKLHSGLWIQALENVRMWIEHG